MDGDRENTVMKNVKWSITRRKKLNQESARDAINSLTIISAVHHFTPKRYVGNAIGN